MSPPSAVLSVPGDSVVIDQGRPSIRKEVDPMTTATPEPGPEREPQPDEPQPDEPQPCGEGGGPRFSWVPGSELDGVELSGPVPPEALPGGTRAAGVPAGLDWQAMLDALAASGLLDGDPENQDAELADELAAEKDGRMGPSLDPARLAALTVEYMEPGPALAA